MSWGDNRYLNKRPGLSYELSDHCSSPPAVFQISGRFIEPDKHAFTRYFSFPGFEIKDDFVRVIGADIF